MPVVLVVDGVTQELYEESVRKLSPDKDVLESPADWPVPGLLSHITGQGENGFRIIDVWESQEALDKFAAHLMPVLAEIGMDAKPDIYQAHTFARRRRAALGHQILEGKVTVPGGDPGPSSFGQIRVQGVDGELDGRGQIETPRSQDFVESLAQHFMHGLQRFPQPRIGLETVLSEECFVRGAETGSGFRIATCKHQRGRDRERRRE